jgi:glycerol kinase
MDLFQIDAAVLPEVTNTASVAGMMRLEVGGHPIPVAARVGDQQAACFAHGVREGQAKFTLGTSAMLDVGLGADWPKPPAGAHVLPLWRLTEGHQTVEPSCVEGSIAAAGASVEWLVRLGLLTAVTELDHAAMRGRSGVTVVPALAGLGTPHDHNAARGVVIGLALDTEPADIALAVVEGIAQRGAEVAEALGIDSPLPVDGGLSRSTVLLQRLADATGQPVLPALDPETALRGAAMLAAISTDYRGMMGEVELGDPVLPACSLDERQGRRARFAAAVEATLQNVDD